MELRLSPVEEMARRYANICHHAQEIFKLLQPSKEEVEVFQPVVTGFVDRAKAEEEAKAKEVVASQAP